MHVNSEAIYFVRVPNAYLKSTLLLPLRRMGKVVEHALIILHIKPQAGNYSHCLSKCFRSRPSATFWDNMRYYRPSVPQLQWIHTSLGHLMVKAHCQKRAFFYG